MVHAGPWWSASMMDDGQSQSSILVLAIPPLPFSPSSYAPWCSEIPVLPTGTHRTNNYSDDQ